MKFARRTARDGEVPGPEHDEVRRLRAVTAVEYLDWDSVYRDNVTRVYRLMFAKVGNRPDAEDLTTEVFLTALRPLRLPAPAAAVRAYLVATCRTALARHWARMFGMQVTTLPDDLTSLPAETDLEADAVRRAEQILGALPERYRRVLQLRFLDACTLAETAGILGISIGNVKVLQHRALRRAAQLEKE